MFSPNIGIRKKSELLPENINPFYLLQNGLFRFISAPLRMKPDFIIIGAARAGTTSFYENLCQHPDIEHAAKKEIHYFSINKGGVYRSNFPLLLKRLFHKNLITGEASTSYMLSKSAPSKIKKSLPNIKIIVIIRDQVELIESCHGIAVRRGLENDSIDEAVLREILNNDTPSHMTSLEDMACRYIHRARYDVLLRGWFERFYKKNILIIRNESLRDRPITTCNRVFKFLGLDEYAITPRHMNRQRHASMSDDIKQLVRNYFVQTNQNLERISQ